MYGAMGRVRVASMAAGGSVNGLDRCTHAPPNEVRRHRLSDGRRAAAGVVAHAEVVEPDHPDRLVAVVWHGAAALRRLGRTVHAESRRGSLRRHAHRSGGADPVWAARAATNGLAGPRAVRKRTTDPGKGR